MVCDAGFAANNKVNFRDFFVAAYIFIMMNQLLQLQLFHFWRQNAFLIISQIQLHFCGCSYCCPATRQAGISGFRILTDQP